MYKPTKAKVLDTRRIVGGWYNGSIEVACESDSGKRFSEYLPWEFALDLKPGDRLYFEDESVRRD